MDESGQDFNAMLLSATGLREPTEWVEKRVRALRMCRGNLSIMAIQKMLSCKTRRTVMRFARKIDEGNIIGAICHGNFGKLNPKYRGAFDYVYRCVVVLNKKPNSSVMRQEILSEIGAPVPSARTVRRWLKQCKFIRKSFPRVQAALARRDEPASNNLRH